MQKQVMLLAVVAGLCGRRVQRSSTSEASGGGSKSEGSVERMDFGKTPDGTPVELYVLTNGRITAKVMTYGAILTELHVPDRQGKTADVVLGFDTLEAYLAGQPAFRGDHRPGRQPDRQGAVHARRQGIQAGRQQRAEHPARRPEGVRQGRLEGRGRLGAGRPGRQADLPQPGRRGRLSRAT